MSEETVLTEIEDGVATITINRPERRNAINGAANEALIDAFETVPEKDDVRVIVLTGAGDKSFCSGGDLQGQQSGDGFLAMHEQRGRYADLLLAMRDSAKPIIARVNGYALGGGLGLVLSSDLAVASESAELGTPEIKSGLFPMMITAVIQRNIGRKKSMEMMLTGEHLSGSEAADVGIVNYAVPDEELDEQVDQLAGRIAGFSPAILKLGRKAFYETQDMNFEEALRTLHNYLTINGMTEDFAEGIMARMAKREPEWKGK